MRRFSGLTRFAVVAAAFVMLMATPARAQKAPDDTTQEVLIKTALLSLNDANVTGNYAVFHAKLSKPLRDQFPPEKFAEIFKDFRDKHIDYDIVAAKTPIPDEPPKVDGNGKLALKGHFDVGVSNVNYDLAFIMSDNEWKLIAISVNVKKKG